MYAATAILSAVLSMPPADGTADPFPDDSTEPDAAPEPAVTDAVLAAAQDRRVVVTVDGVATEGTLTGISENTIVLAAADGQLLEFDKASLEAVALSVSVPPPAEAVSRHAASCDPPRVNIGGECRVDRAYLDTLEDEGTRLRKGGVALVAVGVPMFIAGIVMMPVGFRGAKKTWEERDGETMQQLQRKAERQKRIGFAGAGLAGFGLSAVAAGGALLGIGKYKVRKAERYRTAGLTLSPSADGIRLGLRGRF